MNRWSDPVPDEVAYRRASGRRHYNARRREQALARQLRFRALVPGGDLTMLLFRTGWQRRLAEALGVHPSTISRDVQRLFFERERCPVCGQRRA